MIEELTVVKETIVKMNIWLYIHIHNLYSSINFNFSRFSINKPFSYMFLIYYKNEWLKNKVIEHPQEPTKIIKGNGG